MHTWSSTPRRARDLNFSFNYKQVRDVEVKIDGDSHLSDIVFSIDGPNQADYRIDDNHRVIVSEKGNIRTFKIKTK